MSKQQTSLPFSIWYTFRLGSFQIGSAMGDILVTSIWNRVMISDFGIAATPVSLLIALRYLLSPLSLWAGHLSDTRPLWGRRRTSYIWLGRGLMVLSMPLLGVSLGRLGAAHSDFLGWSLATLSSLAYGVGTLISGSPYLALVRDSAPNERKGLAITVVEILLISFFAISGITFSFWMKTYDQAVFWQIVIATMIVGGIFWFISISGAEKRQMKGVVDLDNGQTAAAAHPAAFMMTLRRIWADRRTRRFFAFLALATLSAWAQDAILEPFGAEVFDLPAERTTRLNSYWQAATVVTLVGSAYYLRKRPSESQDKVAEIGLIIMGMGIALLGTAALTRQLSLIEVSLVVFGGGFGVYTFGGVSLMAVMASDKESGAYLGLWSLAVLVSKGGGTFLGGALRDLLLLELELSAAVSYGSIFMLEAIGLLVAAIILAKVDVPGFAKEMGQGISRLEAQIASAD